MSDLLSISLFVFSLLYLKFVGKRRYLMVAIFFIFIYLLFFATDFIFNKYTGKSLDIWTLNIIIVSITGAPLLTFTNNIILICLLVFAIILICAIICKRIKLQKSRKFLFFVFIFVCAFVTNPTSIALFKIYKYYFYVPVEKYKEIIYQFVKIPEPKVASNSKNIVYIYLEGLSRNFTVNEKFPNLTPNIRNLNHKIEWTNIDPYSTAITIEGLFGSQCAFPLNFFSKFETEREAMKTQKIICATEILKNQGYYTYFMKGFDLNFQNTASFLQSRKYDEMIGKDELLKRGAKNTSEWGVYDDEMFDFAWQDFIRLNESGKKFAQVVLTNSTHTPDGFLPPKCADISYEIDSAMLKSVKCTDKLLGEFISKIRASKYSKNTIIVVQNDHLMPYLFVSDIDKFKDKLENPQSKMLFMILDDDIAQNQYISIAGSSFDTWTTLLGYMGILDEMNFGRNLFRMPTVLQDTPSELLRYTMRILDKISYDEIEKYKN